MIVGQQALIDVESIEAQIIFDTLEDGYSYRLAWAFIAFNSVEEGNEPFSLLDVITLSKRMVALVTKVPMKSQGSYNADSAWARARKTWTTQLLIRYGLLDSQVDKNGNITDFFNKEELFALKAEATACWDETHEVCDIGDNSN